MKPKIIKTTKTYDLGDCISANNWVDLSKFFQEKDESSIYGPIHSMGLAVCKEGDPGDSYSVYTFLKLTVEYRRPETADECKKRVEKESKARQKAKEKKKLQKEKQRDAELALAKKLAEKHGWVLVN